MIKIDFLKKYPHLIPELANIWHEVLGKIWMPEIGIDEIESLYHEELHRDIPFTYIALYGETPVGSCTLELNGGIRPDLGPWIGDLVVAPKFQKQGIGKMLVDVIVEKAKKLGFEKLYLFAFDPTIPEYYERLGWKKIGMDEFNAHPVTVMAVSL
ncbi:MULTISPECIES: GNAT family N-acetyltransferase [Legionella]|uniref:GNAT family N-acetyltransferase n=1 Tax=Legionella TaxID=445 RepID=UPI00096841F2|nr:MULTISPECIES: GNAT family N-acetyltransferase [Legionella]MBN9228432.1 GNAT family N-acetyltransferase [Legionella steelei]OJW08995.1 MAG: GNAT family N-acetyltransferase [Legionella sp. 39-23]